MWFACPLCIRRCQVRTTKKGKPYLICDVCGLQMFVRYEAGIARLADRARVVTGRRSGTADPSGALLAMRGGRDLLPVRQGRSPETLSSDPAPAPKSYLSSAKKRGRRKQPRGE